MPSWAVSVSLPEAGDPNGRCGIQIIKLLHVTGLLSWTVILSKDWHTLHSRELGFMLGPSRSRD